MGPGQVPVTLAPMHGGYPASASHASRRGGPACWSACVRHPRTRLARRDSFMSRFESWATLYTGETPSHRHLASPHTRLASHSPRLTPSHRHLASPHTRLASHSPRLTLASPHTLAPSSRLASHSPRLTPSHRHLGVSESRPGCGTSAPCAMPGIAPAMPDPDAAQDSFPCHGRMGHGSIAFLTKSESPTEANAFHDDLLPGHGACHVPRAHVTCLVPVLASPWLAPVAHDETW
jgi:hypothetical protein